MTNSGQDAEIQFVGYQKRLVDGGEIIYRRDIEPHGDDVPLVTIVTTTLNSRRTIDRALGCVRRQTYPHIEHVVVDGGSSDGTIELLLNVKETLGQFIHGRDTSPADAANKGIVVSRGEFVCLLPSDDAFQPDYVANALEAIRRSKSDFVFGDLVYMRGAGSALIPGDPHYSRSIRHTMPSVNATSLLMRRRSFDAIGLFDANNRYCADYDWLLRAHLAGLRGSYHPTIRSYFSHGGISSANYFAALARVGDVAIAHGCPPLKAHVAFARGVTQKLIRTVLRNILPERMFYSILRRATRTGTIPLVEDSSRTL